MNKDSEKEFKNRYQNLNQNQKRAVDTIEGPVLVVAGPGSGKTELLSLRAANILRETQATPGNILLLTFTENGAKNMRERIVRLIGESGYRIAIYTFHAFASDILSRYAEYFFDGASFKVATEVEKLNIIESILESLERDNPLSSKHPEMGYSYLYDIVSCISALKKGNYSGEEFKEEIKRNESDYKEINQKVGEYFLEIAGKRKFDLLKETYYKIYNELNSIKENDNRTAKFLANILALEIKQAEEVEKASNLTKWKDEYFTKDDEERFILKDSREEKIKKWIALEDIYEKYNQKMYENGLYDFDDMIFKVGRELAKNESLRNELEERYQYIMIDEFQDTSDAQFALVESLTKSPINEGRPNILAVGDDDQAIFKFQGAELDNITKFIKNYRDVELITLDKNYRSTQNILDEARRLITKIGDRLETRFPEINKNIKAENEELLKKHRGEIIEKNFDNIYSEFDFIAKEINSLLEKGVDPKQISVISRTHANLKNLANIFNEYKVPYSYEKEENVFDKAPIKEIITLVEFADTGLENVREDLIPEILSFKFWNLDRIEIWKIAEKVRVGEEEKGEFGERVYKRVSWLKVMLDSENEKVKNVAKFLIELMSDAKSLPLLHLIDKIIGTKEWEIESEYGYDDSDGENKKEIGFISPFREYYFGKENFDHNKPEYLDFLFALRTFIGSLREYKGGEILYGKDLKDFVAIYENNSNLTLSTISPFATSDKAVILQTAHKSKGLEYEYIFIVNSDENEWNGRKRVNKIGLPINMPLLPSSDDIADRVRLYYVAMTRAKHTLYITNNKEKFSMLLTEKEKKEENKLTDSLINSLYPVEKKIIIKDEKALLKRVLENYKMPVTHLINFLNIGKVGPEKFLEQNLLRFPQAMSPSSIYGSAIHEAIQNYYLYKKKYDKNPDFDRIINFFRNALNRGALSKIEYEKYYNSGVKNLEVFIEELEKEKEVGNVEVEVNFQNEGVQIKNASATGKIDKLIINGDSVSVTDFKTGKSFKDWESAATSYDKIKIHFFKYQLAFYSLLLKNSRSYEKFNFDAGFIEFVEKDSKNKINILEIKNDKDFQELLNRVESLTNIVYEKVINLDFPDTSNYKIKDETGEEKEITLKDILRFEEDLLNGKI